MAAGRFDRRLPLPRQGRIPIKGPFNPQDRAVDAARVQFLIVQGEDENAVIVNGEGSWHRARGNDWRGTAPRSGPRVSGHGTGTLRPGARPRHRAGSRDQAGKVFDRGRRFDPPSIESLTWCADFHFV